MLSYVENIPAIVKVVEELNLSRIVDVGAGFGKYGMLCREAILSKRAENGEVVPDDDIEITAVEDTRYFDRYLQPGVYYDSVIHQSMFEVPRSIWYAHDLALIIDVVEHFRKPEILALIARITEQDCRVLVSTPKNTVMYVEHYYGDQRHHITQWQRADFDSEFFTVERDDSTELSHILVLGPKA